MWEISVFKIDGLQLKKKAIETEQSEKLNWYF